MPLLCSIELVDITLPTFSKELLVLEALAFTEVVSLLCISYHPLCSHPTHYFKVNCKTDHSAIKDNTIIRSICKYTTYRSTCKYILVHTTHLSHIIVIIYFHPTKNNIVGTVK